MNLKPEDIRSIHKVGPIRAVTIPVNVGVCAAAYFLVPLVSERVNGLIAMIIAFVGMQIFWVLYATILPNYCIKKMDGTLLMEAWQRGYR